MNTASGIANELEAEILRLGKDKDGFCRRTGRRCDSGCIASC